MNTNKYNTLTLFKNKICKKKNIMYKKNYLHQHLLTDKLSDYENISDDSLESNSDTLHSLPASGSSSISDTISNFQNVYKLVTNYISIYFF